MWTRNYDYLMDSYKIIASQLDYYDRNFFVDFVGIRRFLQKTTTGSTFPSLWKNWTATFVDSFSEEALTIEIGGGDSFENYEDYDLAFRYNSTQVNKVSPVTMGKVEIDWETGAYKQWVEIDFKNITTSDLIVKEYGVYAYSALTNRILLYRKVLEEPITIPAGQYYKVRFDYEFGGRSFNDKLELTDSWDTIIENINNGTAADLYSVGMYRPLQVTKEDGTTDEVMMEIIGINHDVLADGSGNATLSWLSKDCYYSDKMYSTNNNEKGWRDSIIRDELNQKLYFQLPENIKNSIKTVSKSSNIYQDGQKTLVVTNDKLWIPSPEEMCLEGGLEGQGTPYTYFTNPQKRKKYLKNNSTKWWLRSRHEYSSSYGFYTIAKEGGIDTNNSNVSQPIAFGFCL